MNFVGRNLSKKDLKITKFKKIENISFFLFTFMIYS